MPREALIAIGAGLASAVASLAFVAGVPFALMLVYLAPLPLMMAGLALGVRATLTGAAAGLLATGWGGGLASGLIYAFAQALPAILIVALALMRRRDADPQGADAWFPAATISAHLAALAGLMMLLTALMSAGEGLSGTISTHLGDALEVMAPHLPDDVRQRFASMLVPLFPGAVAASWVVMAAVNAALAQGFLVRLGRNLRPSPVYTAVDLPNWLSWPLVGAAVVALAGSGEWEYVGRNAAMTFAVPYFLLGLAVVHSLARKVTYTGLLLVALYLVIVVSLWAALVVAGIGVVEQWIGLRDRTGTSAPPSGRSRGDDEDN